MTTGTPAILLVTPPAAGLGTCGVHWGAREAYGGGHVGAHRAPAVRAAALPRPGVSSSTPAAACCTAAPQTRSPGVAAHPAR
jgi:hypothetical protein